MNYYKMYIDGQWVDSVSKDRQKTLNPATGEVIAEFSNGTPEDVDLAVAAAWRSFYETRDWRDMDSQSRGDFLLKIADAIEAHKDELAYLDTIDMGKPLREAEADIDDGIHCFRYYASLIKTPHGGVYEVNEGFGKMHSYTLHEPVGVCALITPWNYPFLMGVWKLAPALAAGNSVIYKPSSNCVLSSVKLFEIFEEVGLPAGAANLVMGPGGAVGDAMSSHPGVEMVTFTGSTAVGQSIMRNAASNVKKIGLELGGKSPNVIFDDADLEGAVEWAMIGIFLNQGEVCSAGSRIIVQEGIHDAFVKRLAEKANAITIGNPLNNPDMGPLVSESHMNKVLGYIRKGIEEGAELVCGGERYTEGECAKGYFVRPTVFDHCTSDMAIVREEIFGPVVTVQTFRTKEEAIAMANDTEYGLAGAVFTSDVTTAMTVIKELRAGITWINCYNPTFNEAPWGGYKKSGIGRELGVHGLEEYQEIKQININLTPGPVGWYEH
ncbi:MAG: aldehyde dehydrogenase family protein [Lachnospiraceae bacterium]|nr:aldehyde dehydrogenase family protein [Lachnospiraceae bacterium]